MPHIWATRYAVASCHVERPLDDRVWARFSRLQAARPGGFRIAALMRPPDPETGEDETIWLERARTAAAHGPLGHHTHWTSPTHARPTARRRRRARPPRGRMAPRAGPPPHALLRRRLVHGRVGRPRRRRARLRRLHRDELPTPVPGRRSAAALARCARTARAPRRGRAARASDDAFARDGGARGAAASAALPSRSSTSTSTTPTCSTGAARSLSASRSRCSAAAAPPPTSIGSPS